MSEILAYMMAVGLHAVYRGPSSHLQNLVFDKGNLCLFSFLVYAQNQKNWPFAIMDALDPAGPLQLRARLDLNIEVFLVWIYSTRVNVAGNMHPLDENPAVNREPTQLPGFLFPSDRPYSLANLRRSYGPEIPNAHSASGRECPSSIHSPLCKGVLLMKQREETSLVCGHPWPIQSSKAGNK